MISAHLPAGTKIVALGSGTSQTFVGPRPVPGDTYTVAGYILSSVGKPYVVLAEFPQTNRGSPFGYSLSLFNLVQETKLPASILDCLNARPKRVNKREKADA